MKDSQTKHTITTLIYPADAERLGGNGILNIADAVIPNPEISHFDTQLGIRGSTLLVDKDGIPAGLDTPGLYVFVCKIHPYMFGAVIVDDPETNLYIGGVVDEFGDPIPEEDLLPFPLLDLSDNLVVLTRTGDEVAFGVEGTVFPTKVPPTHDLATTLLKTFYVITDPNNWRDYQESTWTVNLPPVLATTNTEELAAALAYDAATTVDIATALGLTNSTGSGPVATGIVGLELDMTMPNPALFNPDDEGIGEVWVNTQFERTVNKNFEGSSFDQPGTITVVDTSSWDVERKISLPDINMNHPHNMWADTKNEVIYQTEWFGNEIAVIDRESGELIKEVYTGQSPSHDLS